jgi:hypothetical protein
LNANWLVLDLGSNMKRREFISVVGGTTAVFAPRVARAATPSVAGGRDIEFPPGALAIVDEVIE